MNRDMEFPLWSKWRNPITSACRDQKCLCHRMVRYRIMLRVAHPNIMDQQNVGACCASWGAGKRQFAFGFGGAALGSDFCYYGDDDRDRR